MSEKPKTATLYYDVLDELIAGEIIREHDNGDVTIRYAGSLEVHGTPLTIDEIIGWRRR